MFKLHFPDDIAALKFDQSPKLVRQLIHRSMDVITTLFKKISSKKEPATEKQPTFKVVVNTANGTVISLKCTHVTNIILCKILWPDFRNHVVRDTVQTAAIRFCVT